MKILPFYFGEVEKTAYGICYKSRGNKEGWTVIFRYKDSSNRGRAVTMDLDGKNIKIEHTDFILSAVDKKL